ncbi:alpha/beta hydrolase family domain-containing protein [Rhizoctonia solani AG-1 IA]|uniref:Alpha/beta hydrolase family domain-containing protein n=1 Tax=Thanatephorus cucumeris (strain AG1-IA) TaxID=983506 RepID=L8WS06_THACA|nr:alpha/beta hydrolase family domain-containing protein [Rhizoctonia solani AG-1 IA]
MFISSTLVAGISLATAASAAPTLESRGFFDFFFPTSNSPSTTGTCTQSRVPISVQADTTAISMGKPVNQGDLTGFLAEYWATGSTVASQVAYSNADGSTQKRRIQGTYNIWSQVCHPKGVQGQVINFDHSYWEFGYSKEYNFIEAANKAGYAVLTYDRLGVGQSDKPDGVNIVQSSTEVEILHQFIQQSRASGKYSKISGIGHSFGS